jgi:iron complex outermembrane receptor protein
VGATPIPDLDVWVTYVYQNADKGSSPPDAGAATYSIWHWP